MCTCHHLLVWFRFSVVFSEIIANRKFIINFEDSRDFVLTSLCFVRKKMCHTEVFSMIKSFFAS